MVIINILILRHCAHDVQVHILGTRKNVISGHIGSSDDRVGKHALSTIATALNNNINLELPQYYYYVFLGLIGPGPLRYFDRRIRALQCKFVHQHFEGQLAVRASYCLPRASESLLFDIPLAATYGKCLKRKNEITIDSL